MSRAVRRALLRGVLPALLGLLLVPFAPSIGTGAVFFALVGTALTLIDLELAPFQRESLRGAVLFVAATGLYTAAAFQTVYAQGVLNTGTLKGGLQAIGGFAHVLLHREGRAHENLGLGLLVFGSLGVAHATVVLGQAPPRPWDPDAEIRLIFLGSVATVSSSAFLTCGLSYDTVGQAAALTPVVPVTVLLLAGALAAVTLTCDRIERALWPPATPDESSPPGPSSRPHP